MLDRLDKISKAQEKEIETQRAYKSIFSSELGQRVFEDMLWHLKFLAPCENEGDMALSNYAKQLINTVYGSELQNNSNRLFKLIRNILKRKES